MIEVERIDIEKLRGNVSRKTFLKMCRMKGDFPINPIGSCYDSAIKLFMTTGSEIKDLRLCHGIISANAPGQEGNKITHAWIEYMANGVIMHADVIWGESYPQSLFEEMTEMEYVVRYDREQLLKIMSTNISNGPWDKKLIDLQNKIRPRKLR